MLPGSAGQFTQIILLLLLLQQLNRFLSGCLVCEPSSGALSCFRFAPSHPGRARQSDAMVLYYSSTTAFIFFFLELMLLFSFSSDVIVVPWLLDNDTGLRSLRARLNPFRTAVPFWGQTTQIL